MKKHIQFLSCMNIHSFSKPECSFLSWKEIYRFNGRWRTETKIADINGRKTLRRST